MSCYGFQSCNLQLLYYKPLQDFKIFICLRRLSTSASYELSPCHLGLIHGLEIRVQYYSLKIGFFHRDMYSVEGVTETIEIRQWM